MICNFTSDLDLIDSATYYQDAEGVLNEINFRELCPLCNRTIMIGTPRGVNATFVTRHRQCVNNNPSIVQFVMERMRNHAS